MKRPALFSVVLAIALIALAAGSLLAYRHQMLLTRDIVNADHWPPELTALVQEARDEGDIITGIDVRSVGLVTTYCWQMPATDSRIQRHIQRFKLTRVTNDGAELARILSCFPTAWKRLTNAGVDVYAFPHPFARADDGEFEFIMLHDKPGKALYFYYYFNF